MVSIKSSKEIETMRVGGAILARILRILSGHIEPGFNIEELDSLADTMIRETGAEPSFKGYEGYPASICVSVNDEVVHGVPYDVVRRGGASINDSVDPNVFHDSYVLKLGDVVSLDCGVKYKGLHTDSAVTVSVGEVSAPAKKLLAATKEALGLAIGAVKDGATTGDIGNVVEWFAQEHSLGNVRELVGHGIGKKLQEDPMVPNFGTPGKGARLKEGMTIAIEPMFTLGTEQVVLADDGFTYKTRDGSLAAHFEHTVAVTKNGADILTQETA